MLEITSTNTLKLPSLANLDQCNLLIQQGDSLWSQLPKEGIITIDCSQLQSIDSSLLAILLHWQSKAQSQSRSIKLIHVPYNLQDLAKLYDVGNWIDGLARK